MWHHWEFVCNAVLVSGLSVSITSLHSWIMNDIKSSHHIPRFTTIIIASERVTKCLDVFLWDLMNFRDHMMLGDWHTGVRWAGPVNIYWKCKLFGRIQPLRWLSFWLAGSHLNKASHWLMKVTILWWHNDTWFIIRNDHVMTCLYCHDAWSHRTSGSPIWPLITWDLLSVSNVTCP